jgi:hypothetical protein
VINDRIHYPNGWSRYGNVVYYNKHWQKPANTEQTAFNYVLKSARSKPIQFLCFPWATLIDLKNNNKYSDLLKELEYALLNLPPTFGLERVTFCQHIFSIDLFPLFRKLQIKHVFWSHKTRGQNEHNKITISPLPLVPVQFFSKYKTNDLNWHERKYLFNFLGSYDPKHYLNKTRMWIFKHLANDKRGYVVDKGLWHFQNMVYKEQIAGIKESNAERKIRDADEKDYVFALENSKFTLCPSGTGPNSIRFWEALEFGSIPVLISEQLDLGCIVASSRYLRVSERESSIVELPKTLEHYCPKITNSHSSIVMFDDFLRVTIDKYVNRLNDTWGFGEIG